MDFYGKPWRILRNSRGGRRTTTEGSRALCTVPGASIYGLPTLTSKDMGTWAWAAIPTWKYSFHNRVVWHEICGSSCGNLAPPYMPCILGIARAFVTLHTGEHDEHQVVCFV